MKLLNFSTANDNNLRLGIMTAAGIIDVAATAAAHQLTAPTNVHAAIRAGADSLASIVSAADSFIDPASVNYGPVVTAPEKILCVGLNYRLHAAEAGSPIPETPVLFSKFNNTLAGHGEDIPLPANAVQYDYEVELGVVIGKTARYVSEADALDYVFGYCTVNDFSTRELQMRTSQWLLGKTMDKAMPCGPYLVTADEVGDPHNLRLTTHLNGELRQDSNTNDLIFNVNQVISYASQYFTLKPGDIISTGTPSGVILGMNPKVWLKPGDTVTVEVANLGACTNRLTTE
ncbi:MAG: fumarylacetoacetate hydrolase family protein [Anaerolineales bacterium]|nr:fumarylacetoacetate hydrolase family protein [Anaerolineales bacterium]